MASSEKPATDTRPMLLVKTKDDLLTTTRDAIRVWLTDGNKPEDTVTVAVMVRVVGNNTRLHASAAQWVEEACRDAVNAILSPASDAVVFTTSEAAESANGEKEGK